MKKAFTLAEVLITLAIIGVVAAITIPSVIVNTNQMEFKTGLRKAVSVLNQAITLNKALTGESPYDNDDLYSYLQQNMSVTKTCVFYMVGDGLDNKVFYTTDGMRYELGSHPAGNYSYWYNFPLHENSSVYAKENANANYGGSVTDIGKCGSLGLANNPNSTTEPPCIIMVDVNGDRKPSPPNAPVYEGINYYGSYTYATYNLGDNYSYKKADPNGRLLTDVFSIMITDQGAIPYGVVAQKAMYQAQK